MWRESRRRSQDASVTWPYLSSSVSSGAWCPSKESRCKRSGCQRPPIKDGWSVQIATHRIRHGPNCLTRQNWFPFIISVFGFNEHHRNDKMSSERPKNCQKLETIWHMDVGELSSRISPARRNLFELLQGDNSATGRLPRHW